MAESSEELISQENGTYVANGSMKVKGNLEVETQLTTSVLKVLGDNQLPVVSTSGSAISFKKAVEFLKPVQFNNGKTIIGMETTYNSAYVGSQTIQAGDRLVVGDSLFKVDADTRSVIADTFKMTLARLNVDKLVSKKEVSDFVDAKKVQVTEELVAQEIFADTIKTNRLRLDNICSRGFQASEELTTRDLIVGGSAKVENDITIMGKGAANGAALTVNGGEIVANKGIVSHTRNNRFQTLQIMGSGTDHDVCFRIDKNVDSVIEGDVTIQDSKLVLDNSKLATDNIVVTPLSEIASDDPLSGIQITTQQGWEDYKESMVQVVEAGSSTEEEYDPVQQVGDAIARNESNYAKIHSTVKSLVNPITYLMEQNDSNIPKRFNVKSGVYRIDNNGNALLRNMVAETGTFSKLEAYKFNVNRLQVDKLVTTAVASNVVHTDNLLKSEGIAEFDGVVNSAADVFIESGSNVNVDENAKMTFQSGSSLVIQDGARFEMGSDTTVRMGGDVEIDLNKLVFVDSATGRKFKISFRDAHESEGGGIVMDYSECSNRSSQDIVEETELDSRELNNKLKQLGL